VGRTWARTAAPRRCRAAVGELGGEIGGDDTQTAVPRRQALPSPLAQSGARAEPASARLHYLDYLRAGVVALVMAHHTAITYGAAGSWYYSDNGTSLLPKILLTMFTAFNQAYFMAFLFFLSGYLSIPSYTRKGAARYAVDRVRRFGIPLVVYLFAISPIVSWIAIAAHPGVHPPLLAYWRTEYLSLRTFDAGPLWFVEALLLMDLLFVAWARWFARVDLTVRPGGSFPRGRLLAVFALLLGAASFLVRQGMPVGATFFSLQLAYFPSYVAMFVLGLLAWRQRWLDAIPDAASRWARWAVVGSIVLLPIILLTGASASSGVTAFYGGLHWQALAYALWEPWVLVGMSIVLVCWGQRRLNQPSRRWQGWSGASYVAYIIQPLVLVPAAVLFQGTSWPVLDKFALVASLTILATYTVARGLRLIPPVRAALG